MRGRKENDGLCTSQDLTRPAFSLLFLTYTMDGPGQEEIVFNPHVLIQDGKSSGTNRNSTEHLQAVLVHLEIQGPNQLSSSVLFGNLDQLRGSQQEGSSKGNISGNRFSSGWAVQILILNPESGFSSGEHGQLSQG